MYVRSLIQQVGIALRGLEKMLLQVAEEEGFEPPEPCGSTVFKTAAIDHSATPPHSAWV